MQTIAVLADKVLKHPAILQLHKCHMSRRRNRLQSINRPQGVLAPLRHQRPGTLRPAKVSDPSGGRDTGTREGDQVPARADPVRKDLRLLVHGRGGLVVLYLGDFGRGVGHLGRASGARGKWRVLLCMAREESTLSTRPVRRPHSCMDDVDPTSCASVSALLSLTR